LRKYFALQSVLLYSLFSLLVARGRSAYVYSGVPVPKAFIRFPVTCPKCASEQLINLPVAEITNVVLRGENVYLSARCCGVVWVASEIECEQIREYLAEVKKRDKK
jgi:phosphatidylserine synthase